MEGCCTTRYKSRSCAPCIASKQSSTVYSSPNSIWPFRSRSHFQCRWCYPLSLLAISSLKSPTMSPSTIYGVDLAESNVLNGGKLGKLRIIPSTCSLLLESSSWTSKLNFPSPLLYCLWFFYQLYMCKMWLNILAELLQFGDHEFYKEWWNAKIVEGCGICSNASHFQCKSFPILYVGRNQRIFKKL